MRIEQIVQELFEGVTIVKGPYTGKDGNYVQLEDVARYILERYHTKPNNKLVCVPGTSQEIEASLKCG